MRAMPATQGCLFLGQVSRIRFGKSGSDLGPPTGLPRSHGHESNDFAQRTGIRSKLALFSRIPLARETEFEPR